MKTLISILFITSILFISCNKEACQISNPENISYLGCSDFMVFDEILISGTENTYITIQVERNEVTLTNDFKSFEIQNNSSISSEIKAFNKNGNNYCTDALIFDLQEVNTWSLESGTVDLRIVREKSECDETYVVDAVLNNAIYKDSQNNELIVSQKEFFNILVNYLLG